jgi:hypothetical protein
MRPCLLSLIAFLTLAGRIASADQPAPAPPVVPEIADGSITIHGSIVALGIGYEWARGTLVYHGRTYPFRVRGFSVMDLGAARIIGGGEVFNLHSLADFAGNYAGSTFGSAVSHGASLALFKNEHGVAIRTRSTISGVRFNLSGNGMRIEFTAPSGHSED